MTALDRIQSRLIPFIEAHMDEWKVPGVALAIVNKQETVYAAGFGLRNVEQKLPVTEDTLFPIASSSKAFLTTAVGMLVDECKLDWDAPVRRYLPDLELQDEMATLRLSLRDMACHRSGLPRHDLVWYNSKVLQEEQIRRIRYLEPSYGFRSRWQYNNLMYMSMGHVVSTRAGQTWYEWIQERIFRPLSMGRSNFYIHESKRLGDYALPYDVKDGRAAEIEFYIDEAPVGDGSINSSAIDLTRWVIMNLAAGTYGDTRLISEAQLAEIHSPHMIVPEPLPWKEVPLNAYGLGWFIQPYRGHKLIHHGGAIDGFASMVSFMPDEEWGVVILCNLHAAQSSLFLEAVRNVAYDALLGLPEIDWNARVVEYKRKREEDRDAGREAERDLAEEADTTAAANGRTAADGAKAADGSDGQVSPPTHPLASFAGLFKHPGYGDILIELGANDDANAEAGAKVDRGGLKLTFNTMEHTLQHIHHNVFELQGELAGMRCTFQVGADGGHGSDGYIVGVSLPLEGHPNVQPIVFGRK